MRAALTASAPTTQLLLVAGRNPEQKKKKKKEGKTKKKLFPIYATRRGREKERKRRKRPQTLTQSRETLKRTRREEETREETMKIKQVYPRFLLQIPGKGWMLAGASLNLSRAKRCCRSGSRSFGATGEG